VPLSISGEPMGKMSDFFIFWILIALTCGVMSTSLKISVYAISALTSGVCCKICCQLTTICDLFKL
jgi:hypothetical protein